MKKYIIVGGDGKEYGPVSGAEVTQWITGDRANGDTRIKEKGAEEWQRLRDLELFDRATGTPIPPTLSESSSDPQITEAQLIEELADRPHTFSVRECLGLGWRLTRENFGLFILTYLCLVLVSMLAGMIPLGSLLVSGPIAGGMYLIFLRRLRGEHAEIGQLFAGFKEAFWPLFLTYLFITVVVLLLFFVLLLPLTVVIVIVVLYASGGVGDDPAAIRDVVYLSSLFLGLGMLALMVLTTTLGEMLGFSILLVMDRKMEPAEAFKATWKITRQCWGKFLGLSLVLITINLAGVLLCCLGLLIAVPLTIATMTVIYEQLLGRGVIRKMEPLAPVKPT